MNIQTCEQKQKHTTHKCAFQSSKHAHSHHITAFSSQQNFKLRKSRRIDIVASDKCMRQVVQEALCQRLWTKKWEPPMPASKVDAWVSFAATDTQCIGSLTFSDMPWFSRVPFFERHQRKEVTWQAKQYQIHNSTPAMTWRQNDTELSLSWQPKWHENSCSRYVFILFWKHS
jgi:hypothetical protein